MKSHVATCPTRQQQHSYKSNPNWKRAVANILLVASLSFTTMTSVSAESSLPLHQVSPQETESFINQFFARPEVKSALKGAVVTVVHDQQIV